MWFGVTKKNYYANHVMGVRWLGGQHVCLTPPGLGVRIPPPSCVWSLYVLPVPRGFPP
ncbi:hypothetical protein QTP70_017578, partial [Hemibagrus guttatus]